MDSDRPLFGARDVSTAAPSDSGGQPWGESAGAPAIAREGAPGDTDTDLASAQYRDRLLEAQDMERLRLGQELHDCTSQLLVALKLNVARVRRSSGSPGSPEILEEIESTASEIEQQIRALSFLNYPAPLFEEGLIATLQSFSRGFARKTGIHVFFRSDGSLSLDHIPVAVDLLRVAQEALANVFRHAHASLVRIAIAVRGDQIELSIKDDGRGLPAGRAVDGVGLQSMRHRVERHGGSLTIRNRRQGTAVVARIPVAQPH